MAYMFRYAGDDRPYTLRVRTPAQRESDDKKYAKRKAKNDAESIPLLITAPPPSTNDELQAELFAKFNPPATCGLPPSYRQILQEVCHKHHVPYADVIGRSRDYRVGYARREFMYRCMEEIPTASYAGVGRRIQRDHTTVLHAHRRGLADPSCLEPFVPKPVESSAVRTKRVEFTDTQKFIIERIKAGGDYKLIAAELGKPVKWMTNQLYEIRGKIARLNDEERAEQGLGNNFGRVEAMFMPNGNRK